VDFVQAALATHSRLHHSVEQRTKYYLASVVDSVIGMGGRVEAVVLCGSSSVRQFGELTAFGDAVFAQVGRSEQMHIYHDMRARNARRIAADGLSHDAALTDDWDPRRCLAAYVMASSSNFIPSPKLEHTLQQLSSLMPSHVVYQALSSSRPGPLTPSVHALSCPLLTVLMWGRGSTDTCKQHAQEPHTHKQHAKERVCARAGKCHARSVPRNAL
jgi:hypothetical protein